MTSDQNQLQPESHNDCYNGSTSDVTKARKRFLASLSEDARNFQQVEFDRWDAEAARHRRFVASLSGEDLTRYHQDELKRFQALFAPEVLGELTKPVDEAYFEELLRYGTGDSGDLP